MYLSRTGWMMVGIGIGSVWGLSSGQVAVGAALGVPLGLVLYGITLLAARLSGVK